MSYESVVVPAGTFIAYKIAVSVGGRRFREAWYAPETKTVVKSLTPDPQGREIVSELIDYQKGTAAVDVTQSQSPTVSSDLGPEAPPSRPSSTPPRKKDVPLCPWGEYWSSVTGQCTRIGQ